MKKPRSKSIRSILRDIGEDAYSAYLDDLDRWQAYEKEYIRIMSEPIPPRDNQTFIARVWLGKKN
jgi:hypothetical protein